MHAAGKELRQVILANSIGHVGGSRLLLPLLKIKLNRLNRLNGNQKISASHIVGGGKIPINLYCAAL